MSVLLWVNIILFLGVSSVKCQEDFFKAWTNRGKPKQKIRSANNTESFILDITVGPIEKQN